MARPKKQRRVCAEPVRCRFSPEHGAIGDPILLTVDEYEALRLIDLEHLTQEQCAAQMQVARTTVTAIYDTVDLPNNHLPLDNHHKDYSKQSHQPHHPHNHRNSLPRATL